MKKLTPIAASFLALTSYTAIADGSVTGQGSDEAGTLAGAKVSVVGTQSQTSTNYQGEFSLGRLPAGQHKLKVEFLGYPDATFDITVIDNQIFLIKEGMISKEKVF